MRLHSIRQRLSLVVGYDMVVLWRDNVIIYYYIDMYHEIKCNWILTKSIPAGRYQCDITVIIVVIYLKHYSK